MWKSWMRCQEDGYEAYLLFVIQMKGIREFEPNWSTHPQFGEVLQKARNAGVHLLAYDCLIREDYMEIQDPVPRCRPVTDRPVKRRRREKHAGQNWEK